MKDDRTIPAVRAWLADEANVHASSRLVDRVFDATR